MSLKGATASSIKWNTIDKLCSQLVFAGVGIVLANNLSHEDFGLVGVLAVFQAFAMVFIDSGFGAALLRLKKAEEEDYSTVFWFNLLVSVGLYLLLWFATPAIAGLFHGDLRLIPLSKVMFLSFVINGLAIVQTNRMMKQMNVRPLAISNFIGLILGGGLGVWLALAGYGPWALVWQTVAQAGIRTLALWIAGGWLPSFRFTRVSFGKIWRVGLGVFSSSFLNTLFLNIYSLVIGIGDSLPQLGLYTQANKWSIMGSASLSQTMTSSFVPLLSRVQDDGEAFRRYVERINRFSAFVTLPALAGLAMLGEPLFHFLFSDKWDGAIPLFQILCLRGIPVVLVSVLTNYLLALGYARSLVVVEVIKDLMTVVAILSTVWWGSLELLVWGQFLASLLTYVIVLGIVCHHTGYGIPFMLKGLTPFGVRTLAACAACGTVLWLTAGTPAFWQLLLGAVSGLGLYLLTLHLSRCPELYDALAALRGKLR